MRYIGNKENLLDKIYQVMQSKNIQGNSFFDFFTFLVIGKQSQNNKNNIDNMTP